MDASASASCAPRKMNGFNPLLRLENPLKSIGCDLSGNLSPPDFALIRCDHR